MGISFLIYAHFFRNTPRAYNKAFVCTCRTSRSLRDCLDSPASSVQFQETAFLIIYLVRACVCVCVCVDISGNHAVISTSGQQTIPSLTSNASVTTTGTQARAYKVTHPHLTHKLKQQDATRCRSWHAEKVRTNTNMSLTRSQCSLHTWSNYNGFAVWSFWKYQPPNRTPESVLLIWPIMSSEISLS